MQIQSMPSVKRRASRAFVGLAFFMTATLACTNAAASFGAPAATPTRIPIPSMLIDNFMGICVANEGSKSYCSCVMADIQEKYTLQQFSDILSRMLISLADGDMPKELAASRSACQGK